MREFPAPERTVDRIREPLERQRRRDRENAPRRRLELPAHPLTNSTLICNHVHATPHAACEGSETASQRGPPAVERPRRCCTYIPVGWRRARRDSSVLMATRAPRAAARPSLTFQSGGYSDTGRPVEDVDARVRTEAYMPFRAPRRLAARRQQRDRSRPAHGYPEVMGTRFRSVSTRPNSASCRRPLPLPPRNAPPLDA
jgi:hypothetical protein